MNLMLVLAIVCASISTTMCIECFDCESKNDPRCNRCFDPEGVQRTNCDEEVLPEYLHKYELRIKATGCITKVHEGFGGDAYYIRRGCYYGDPENIEEACDEPDPKAPWADLISCSVCEEDLCNTHALNGAHHTNSLLRRRLLLEITLWAIILNNI